MKTQIKSNKQTEFKVEFPYAQRGTATDFLFV